MILITGGAGFIGSNLIHALNEAGITDITVCDFVANGSYRSNNLNDCQFADWIFPHWLTEWLCSVKLEAVVHLAAITDTRRHDGELFVTNYQLSMELFNWCTKHRVPFIYASSAAVYGNGEYGFSESTSPDFLRPLNMYGWSKQAFDSWVIQHGKRRPDHPPLCVGLRLFNVYGTRENHKGKMASVISQNRQRVRDGETVRLFKSHRDGVNDGEQRRDFVHVNDVCSVISWFLDQTSDFGIYNVGTGYARSFRDVIVAMSEFYRVLPQIEYVDMPSEIRSNYQYRTEADIARLRLASYDRPFLSLEEGIARTLSDAGDSPSLTQPASWPVEPPPGSAGTYRIG